MAALPAMRISRTKALSRVLLLVLTAAAVMTTEYLAQNPSTSVNTIPPFAKLIDPWPNADVLRARRVDAEGRALFRTADLLSFTLKAEFSEVNKDRDPNSTKTYPATLEIAGASGSTVSVPIQLAARGHLRRMSRTCDFVPLRIEFDQNAARGTPLEGRANRLKIVTHCRDSKEHEQFVLREYLAYKMLNLITPRSFRARLAKATYADSKTVKTVTTRYATFLEDDDDVARRLEGRINDRQGALLHHVDTETLTQIMVFAFMIGNTDFSLYALHNMRIVQTPSGVLYPVAYDFDFSGLVRPPYAIPGRSLGLKSVTQRLYRGPCRTQEQIAPVLETFRAKKADILNTLQSQPDLNPQVRGEMKGFLNEFFSLIDRPRSVKQFLVDTCTKGVL